MQLFCLCIDRKDKYLVSVKESLIFIFDSKEVLWNDDRLTLLSVGPWRL